MTTETAIKPSSDRKTEFYPGQKNTFGLLPGREGTCPGCTTERAAAPTVHLDERI